MSKFHVVLFTFLLAGLSLPVGAANDVDLGDFSTIVGTDRPDFQPARQAQINAIEAESWPKYDLSCTSAPCASGYLPLDPAWVTTCGALPDPTRGYVSGSGDAERAECLYKEIPAFSTAYLPDGDYEIRHVGTNLNLPRIIRFNQQDKQFECESNTGTTFWGGWTNNTNDGCNKLENGGNTTSANRICGGLVAGFGAYNMWNPTSEVSWTGGYDFNDKVVTVPDAAAVTTLGAVPGEWMMLRMTAGSQESCELNDELTGISPNFQEKQNTFNHYAKVVSVGGASGNEITLDRALPMDYNVTTCGPKVIQRVSPLTNSGVKNCRFKLASTDDPIETVHPQADRVKTAFGKDPIIGFGARTESWFIGNVVDTFDEDAIIERLDWRNLSHSNGILHSYGPTFNSDGWRAHYGTAQNEHVNNYADKVLEFSKQEAGGKLDIWSYNYIRGHNANNGQKQSALFSHGRCNGPFLWEGNDISVPLEIGDRWWGRNCPFNFVYRNRVSIFDGGRYAGITSARNKCETGTVGVTYVDPVANPCAIGTSTPPSPIGSYRLQWPGTQSAFVLGNIAEYFAGTPIPGSGTINFQAIHDIDHLTTGMRLKRNRWLNNAAAQGSGATGPVGWRLQTPEPTTTCDGTCTTENQYGLAPSDVSWSGDVVPHSMSHTVADGPPVWWCEEACSWDDVHNGIGAWGDDFSTGSYADNFNGGLCKLPAQILFEGGTCTPIKPPAPVLIGY